jgi:ligand-binding sensor domain-containing protein
VWAGTCNGLVRISGEKWNVFRKENSGMADNLILSIAEDSSGNIWVGTNKGVSVFDGSAWKTFTKENSLLADNRVQVIKVRDKKVFLGTSNGISVFEE